jgi:hypothetical protein
MGSPFFTIISGIIFTYFLEIGIGRLAVRSQKSQAVVFCFKSNHFSNEDLHFLSPHSQDASSRRMLTIFQRTAQKGTILSHS